MTILRKALGLAAALILSLTPAQGEPMAAPHPAARQALAETMAADHVPAYAVAVYRGEDLVWNEAFGTADIENDLPATPVTLFRTGSIAKLFTATVAARMAEAGIVDLDRPIRDYLPEWPERHPPITLRQLLGHLAGIRHYIPRDRDFSQPGSVIDLRPYADRASILAVFAGDDLLSAPGLEYHYSTFGYALAGLVLEAAGGSDYIDLLESHVLEPGAITGVKLDHMFAIVPGRAAPYDAVEDYAGYLPQSMGPVVNSLPLNSAYKVAAGGLVADAESVAWFGKLHFAPGFLGEDMFRQMMTSQRNAAGEETGTGLGWRIVTDEAGRTLYYHTGSQQGSRAYLGVYPEQRLSIAIMTNLGSRPENIAALGRAVAADFLD
ncbi:serine hydrolase domain-containing protein [Parasphingopyxis marina]|uniref:Beta-lactamase family protein n=1 Tax=Parasphingopyxis marina TaxID=2761622 RepID=A0A842I2J9_9SPHN|nr:serine hydrolase domain-containing protein [Parasphingopyxis marina]MBC2779111.1 beta-lactamase family protein [Parasphingopyxis marina]